MKRILSTVVFSLLALTIFAQPAKIVLVEEGTGTWCQWCPRGDVYGQVLAEDYPDNALFVAVHSGDPMENIEYAAAAAFTALPNGQIDRVASSNLDPPLMANDIDPRLALSPPAGISVQTTFDATTREMTMTIAAEFVENLSGDYRLAAIVVEDGVTGPSPSYDQSNSYSGGANGPMGGYEDLPSPVPASIMVYNHVGRHLAGGYNGDANSLPASISAGATHDYTYTYTLPEAYDEEYVYVIGILVDANTEEVLNAGRSNYLPGYANGKPFFHSLPQEQGLVGLNYQYDILTHDPEHDNLTITAITPLPAGLSLTDLGEGKAVISGMPTTLGTYPVTLNVTDGEWNIEQSFDLVVGEPEEDWIQLGDAGFSTSEADDVDIEISTGGKPYVMTTANDQVFLYEYENDQWALAGPPLPGSTFHSGMALSPDDEPHIFTDGVVSKLSGGNWEQVGGNLPGSDFIFPDIIFDAAGTPYVVYFEPPTTTNTYFFNGTGWEPVGTISDDPAVWNRFHIDEAGNPILIYGTDGSSIAYSEVVQWDGSAWNLLGNDYVEPTSQTYFDHDVAVTPDGDVFAALTIGVGAQKLNIYQLVNGSWELIAEDLTGGATESCNLETDNEGNLMVSFRDETAGGRTSTLRYDGTGWTYMGLQGFTDIASRQSMAVDPDGIPYVAYRDAGESDRVTVKKYEDLSTSVFSGTASGFYQLQLFPNPSRGQFSAAYRGGNYLQVVDLSGKVMYSVVLKNEIFSGSLRHHNIDLSHLPKGIYFVKLFGPERVEVGKVVFD